MNRRELLQSGASAAATASLLTRAGAADSQAIQIIDTNVSLFHWPFRRLPLDETDRLLGKMKELGIARAFAGSFEGIFHRDLASVNQRLADACAPHGQLIPIGSINPALPGWEDDLLHCRDELNMPGIRLHPNYHGYALADAEFSNLVKLATERNLFVQIAAALEDTRTQPTKLQVADVDLAPLPEQLKQQPDSRVQVLNWRPRGAVLESLAESPGVFFDTARVESTDGVTTLLKSVPKERILFGTHAPFLIPEAALIRVHESNLPETHLRAILETNANEFRTG